MFMVAPEDKENAMPLVTINRGLTRASRATMDEIERRGAQITAKIESSGGFAEVVPELTPQWHAAITFAQKERIAAEAMSDRGFGVCVPEVDLVEIRRGRRINVKELLLPGYVLFFAWAADDQIERVRACEGIYDILFTTDGRVAVVPDHVMSEIRKAENRRRPLTMVIDDTRPKKRGRQSRKPPTREIDVHDYDVVGTHSYSPFQEALRQEAEAVRLEAFHKAMGIAA